MPEAPKTWLGKKVNAVAWRKIIEKHPEVVQCFQPGNELLLANVCQRRPRLENAIRQLGPPPKEILDEYMRGDNPQIRRSMVYVAADGLDEASLRQFFAQGYVVQKNAVPIDMVDAALRHINACIGRGAINQNVPGLINVEQHPSFLQLFFGSRLPSLAQSLLGPGKALPPLAAQVALRFPAPFVPSVQRQQAELQCGTAWHVDGFGKNTHSPFTLLLGVCLSDTDAPLQGNFAVHPGAHFDLQEAVRNAVRNDDSTFSEQHDAEYFLGVGPNNTQQQNRRNNRRNKPDLGPPTPLLLKKGDCVLAHQKLPHLGMSNFSANIRYQLYFRLAHINLDQHRSQWLDDLLLPFEGLRASLPETQA